MLRDDVDDAFPRVGEVAEGVLGAVEATGVAESEDGRVMVDNLEVGEGSEICAGA